MKRVITISGLHGTGKSSVADRLAQDFGLRKVSAGIIFRTLAKQRGLTLEEFSKAAEGDTEIDKMLDNTLRQEAAKGNVVLDGQLAAWMAGEHADLRILLTAPLDVRVKRIADRDGSDFKFAKRETIARERSEKARYRKLYGINIADTTVYDIVLNTDKYDLEGVVAVLKAAIGTYLVAAERKAQEAED
jgi:cytidylate kinase